MRPRARPTRKRVDTSRARPTKPNPRGDTDR
uniref:Uncharacterized protein n=1 Tax=Zea mays TaxID=4577 RepID=C0PK78_MAIZE|nr:unknown [Zea mays]